MDRFRHAGEDDRETFRGYLGNYVRLYAFLSQVITFVDTDLEKLYLFGRLLLRRLAREPDLLPYKIVREVELETYNLQQTHSGQIELARGLGKLEPRGAEGKRRPESVELIALSEIVRLLNEVHGVDIPVKEGEQFIALLQQRLAEDEALSASVRVNTPENARLTFNHVISDRIQDMVDVSFKFYKLLNDDPAFAEAFQDIMFSRYLRTAQAQAGA